MLRVVQAEQRGVGAQRGAQHLAERSGGVRLAAALQSAEIKERFDKLGDSLLAAPLSQLQALVESEQLTASSEEAGSAAEPVAGSALGLEVVKVAAPAVG